MDLLFISTPIFSGLILAMSHVVSGPDHIAAVTPLVIETKKKSWKIGFMWGVGHLLGVVIIGLTFLLFKKLISVNLISSYSEQLVGVILIIVGIWSFYRIYKDNKSSTHSHSHISINNNKNHLEINHNHDKVFDKQTCFSSLLIGIIHGFAGVSHLFLLLPILSYNGFYSEGQYLLGFTLGTIITMTATAFILGKISNVAKGCNQTIYLKTLRLASSSFALIVGVYWVITS